MRRICGWVILFFAVGLPLAAFGQGLGVLSPEKLIVGGGAGVFRISYDDFSELYDGRSGFNYGGQALFRFFAPYYAVARLSVFKKDGGLDSTGSEISWRQRGINLGVRYISYRERKLVSYFGFGFVFYNIKEDGAASLFGTGDGSRNATGLFLDGGLEYRFVSRASIFFDVEISSAGIEGKSGFQGNSVGGFSMGLGVNMFVL
jgi:hypothetical protein